LIHKNARGDIRHHDQQRKTCFLKLILRNHAAYL
jgi:hypothetical protein